jgi:hypothetical protein
MLHLYVLSSEPSSARLPAASSSTTAPVGPEEEIDCRSLGELMRAVGCDMSPIQSMDWGSDAVDARVAVLAVLGVLAVLLLARARRERRGVLLPAVAPLLTPPPLSPLLAPSLLLMTPADPSGGRACARVADSLACAASDGAVADLLLRRFFLVGLTPAARPAAGSACGRAATASVFSSCRGAACVSAAATAADAYAACAALNLSLPLMLLRLSRCCSHCHVALGLSLHVKDQRGVSSLSM